MTHTLTFAGGDRTFSSPPMCCCCGTTVDPSNPRETQAVDVTRPMSESEVHEPIVVATCAPCQYHWTETSKERAAFAVLFGLTFLFTAYRILARRAPWLFTCLTAVVALVVGATIIHFVFKQKLDTACNSGPNGPVEAKVTDEGALELKFWNPLFAREFGVRNGVPAEQLKGVPGGA